MTTAVQELEELGPWYHSIDLGDGITTPGRSNVAAKLRRIEPWLPGDLQGARALDLGCNAGGMAVELARRGASVIGVEMSTTYFRQACWVRDRLGLDIDYHRLPVYEIGALPGTFDVVLFLGLIYHLRYPQLALDLVSTKCDGDLFLGTPVVFTDMEVMEWRQGHPGRVHQSEEGHRNWWFPSPSALRGMLSVAGFTDVDRVDGTEGPFVSSSGNDRDASSFNTGTLMLHARGSASGSLPRLGS